MDVTRRTDPAPGYPEARSARERYREVRCARGRHRARERPHRPTARTALKAALTAALGVATVMVVGTGRDRSGGPAAAPTETSASNRAGAAAIPAAQKAAVASHQPDVGTPVSVAISRVGIVSSLQPLGLNPDGSLQSPTDFGQAGWYARGVRPGAVGPAIIAGHIDSYTGPAVFYRLPQVRAGDDVQVQDDRGTTRHFVVTDVEEYAKDRFPSQAVYGPAALPTLRLITCYGAFDERTRSYVDNLVVSAVLTGTR